MTADKGALLAVSYHFPPCGGIASLRTAKTLKYLCRLGWRPLALHAVGVRYHAGEDPSLLEDVRGIGTLPVPAREWGGQGWLSRFCLLPDNKALWLAGAVRAGLRAVESHRPRLILASGAPWTALRAGAEIARRAGLPFVAHFADLWTGNPWYAPATPVHGWLQRRMERALLRSASLVTVATEGLAEAFRRAGVRDPRVFENGYDEEDFQGGLEAPDPGRFTLMHSGTLYVKVTDPVPFLRALKRFLGESPARRTRLRLLGFVDAPFRDRIRDLGLSDIVSLEGSRPHREAVRALGAADVLLLFLGDYPGASVVLHAKTGESLRAGREILAVMPVESLVAKALVEAGVPHPVAPDDEEALLGRLRDLYARWELRGLRAPRVLPRFDRARQVEALSALLERVARGG